MFTASRSAAATTEGEPAMTANTASAATAARIAAAANLAAAQTAANVARNLAQDVTSLVYATATPTQAACALSADAWDACYAADAAERQAVAEWRAANAAEMAAYATAAAAERAAARAA